MPLENIGTIKATHDADYYIIRAVVDKNISYQSVIVVVDDGDLLTRPSFTICLLPKSRERESSNTPILSIRLIKELTLVNTWMEYFNISVEGDT